MEINKNMFRAYDIRGLAGKDLTPDVMKMIGNAFGQMIKEKAAVIASDARTSSPEMKTAFVDGFLNTGKSIFDIGFVPLGAGCFHSLSKKLPLAYITASHLASEWNGAKFFRANGTGFIEDENNKIRDIVLSGKTKQSGKGYVKAVDNFDVLSDYKKYLLSRIKPDKKIRVVLDAGNGMAGLIAPQIFREAGFQTEVVFGELDCTFPNRNPEPGDDPLTALKQKVLGKADLGIAYDGDGDRMVIMDDKGRVLTPEQVSYFILSELLGEQDGPVIANVECTRVIDRIAGQFGRKLHRVKVGHTWLMDAANKHKAVFGVEVSGHYVMPWLMPTDDSLAISFYFAYALSRKREPLSKIVDGIPVLPFRRMKFDCPDSTKFGVMESISKKIRKQYKNTSTLDGVRVELEKGWVLIRASNTGALIRLTIEADDEDSFERIKNEFAVFLQKEIDSVKT